MAEGIDSAALALWHRRHCISLSASAQPRWLHHIQRVASDRAAGGTPWAEYPTSTAAIPLQAGDWLVQSEVSALS
jgi:hypothetical protein